MYLKIYSVPKKSFRNLQNCSSGKEPDSKKFFFPKKSVLHIKALKLYFLCQIKWLNVFLLGLFLFLNWLKVNLFKSFKKDYVAPTRTQHYLVWTRIERLLYKFQVIQKVLLVVDLTLWFWISSLKNEKFMDKIIRILTWFIPQIIV